jgi:hypothetical protein
MGRTECWRSSTRSLSASSYRHEPVSTMCFMWVSSRSTTTHLHKLRHHCPRFTMGPSPWSQLGPSRQGSPAERARYLFSGRTSPQHQRLGRMSTPSAPSSPHSSSRTSCLSRRGEMSCTGTHMLGAGEPATCAGRLSEQQGRRSSRQSGRMEST